MAERMYLLFPFIRSTSGVHAGYLGASFGNLAINLVCSEETGSSSSLCLGSCVITRILDVILSCVLWRVVLHLWWFNQVGEVL